MLTNVDRASLRPGRNFFATNIEYAGPNFRSMILQPFGRVTRLTILLMLLVS